MIEDNPSDVTLTTRVIRSVCPQTSVIVHERAELALDYLTREAKPPQLIFLDLGLVGMDGVTFVRQMKMFKRLESIPIVILTGRTADIVTASAANLQVGYIIKPMEIDEFKSLLMRLELEA